MSYKMNPLVAAGMFGITNMGQQAPSEQAVAVAIHATLNPRYPASVHTMIELFAQPYIESDEHYDIFQGEMDSWYQRFLKEGTEQIQNTWPHHWALYQRAMNQHVN